MEIAGASSVSQSHVHTRQTFRAEVVSKTLDTMNQNQHQYRTENTYAFQKDVLSPHYTGKGTLLDALL